MIEVPALKKRWPVVFTAALSVSAGIGALPLSAGSFFLGPLNREFGWHISDIGLASTFLYAGLAVSAPICGRLVDRLGARPVILCSTLLTALSLALISHTPHTLASFYLLFLLLGLGGAGTTTVAYAKVLTAYFDGRRGLALGLMLAGGSFANIVGAPIINLCIEQYGWRAGYLLEAGWALIPLPAVMLFVPRGISRAPHAAPIAEAVADIEPAGRGPDLVRSRTFWKLALANLLPMVASSALAVHIIPLLTDLGVDRATAAGVVSAGAVGTLCGRISVGALLDHLPGRFLGMTMMFAFSLTLLGIVNGANPFVCYFIWGVCVGSEGDIVAYLTGRHFPLKSYARTYGYLYAFFVCGIALGPIAIKVMKADHESYAFVFTWLALLPLMAGLLFASLGKDPSFAAEDAGPVRAAG